jgi:hypothetical protein
MRASARKVSVVWLPTRRQQMACPPLTVAQPTRARAADAPLATPTTPPASPARAATSAPAGPLAPPATVELPAPAAIPAAAAAPSPALPARTTVELSAAARLALPPTVGLGTLRRLAQLDFGRRAVLSLYADLSSANGLGAAAALEALVAQMHRRLPPGSVERICESLRAMPPLACGARGVAVFAGAGGRPLETVLLPARVDTFAVIDAVPWLEPLAAMTAVRVQRRTQAILRPPIPARR